MQAAKTLIRLGVCPSSSETLLGANAILLVLSRGGSFMPYAKKKDADQTVHQCLCKISVKPVDASFQNFKTLVM